MRQRHLLIALLCFPATVACARFYPSKTPKGINVDPLLSVQLSNAFDETETLKTFLPTGARHFREDQVPFGHRGMKEFISFRSPRSKDTLILRTVQFSRFDSDAAALDDYQSNKRTFSGQGWRLYREEGSAVNKYFSCYKLPWLDSNHGISTRVITAPEILLAFLKRNLLITISYVSYRDDEVDYVREINEDVLVVTDFLRKSLGVHRP